MEKNRQKLSEILKKMVQRLLVDPDRRPSSEAAPAALLLASAAWNLAVEKKYDIALCKTAIREFEECNTAFWGEFKSKKWQKTILRLAEYKKKRYPDDKRIITGCAVMEDKIRVEWVSYPGVERREKSTCWYAGQVKE
jgi:hypothetical protein